MAKREKTRYDGRCRERTEARQGVDPVVRFRNPTSGEVEVHDQVRGRVIFQTEELDDLIIARSDGVRRQRLWDRYRSGLRESFCSS